MPTADDVKEAVLGRSTNLYVAFNNNPLRFVDPTGANGEKADREFSGGEVAWGDKERGTVQVRKGVKVGRHPNLVAISYRGSSPKECSWVQFLWGEEVLGGRPVEKKVGMDIAPKTMLLTTDRSRPHYVIDSKSKVDPRFGAKRGGAVARTAESITMYDMPEDLFTRDAKIEARKARKDLVSVHHFDTFLLCRGRFVYQVSWIVTYKWDGGKLKPSAPAVKVIGGGPQKQPNAPQMRLLNDQYPNWKKLGK